MVRETITTYQRLIPVFIDIDGKKDYTLGAIIETGEKVIVPSESEDGIGSIVESMEESDVG
jgi:hypothetical protein